MAACTAAMHSLNQRKAQLQAQAVEAQAQADTAAAAIAQAQAEAASLEAELAPALARAEQKCSREEVPGLWVLVADEWAVQRRGRQEVEGLHGAAKVRVLPCSH